MRIAFVGSQQFNEEALEDFFDKLQDKYPDAVIVTGDGMGAEKAVAWNCARTGLQLCIPEKQRELFGAGAGDVQVSAICKGGWTFGDEGDPPLADVLVIVGDPKGARPALALQWWKRVWSHEGRVLFGWRAPVRHKLVMIADLPREARVSKKARPKHKREAKALA